MKNSDSKMKRLNSL